MSVTYYRLAKEPTYCPECGRPLEDYDAGETITRYIWQRCPYSPWYWFGDRHYNEPSSRLKPSPSQTMRFDPWSGQPR